MERQETEERKTVSHLKLHGLIREVVEGLKDQSTFSLMTMKGFFILSRRS